MLLELVHETDITYDDTISESVTELRVTPRQERDQLRLSFELQIGPPASVSRYFDWLGNTVHCFSVTPRHERIRIVATSVVETDRPAVDARADADRYAADPPAGAFDGDPAVYDYAQFGGPVVDSPHLRALVADVAPRDGEPLAAIAERMMELIDTRFTYQKGATTFASPITDLLTGGRGVCQDFTHLMIGMSRAIGIPARYVSGLVHPIDPDFRGASETHAWVEILFPTAGWVGFDPTNRVPIGEPFVKVAVGRDFRDVPPNKGVYRGSGREKIKVSVNSRELEAVPPELSPERVNPISIPTAPGGRAYSRADSGQQQQQQQ